MYIYIYIQRHNNNIYTSARTITRTRTTHKLQTRLTRTLRHAREHNWMRCSALPSASLSSLWKETSFMGNPDPWPSFA